MKLRQLQIRMLPGIEPGFTLDDVAPGINLVTGPNAIGKSSLIRALEYLIGTPRSDDPRALALSASLDQNGARWTVHRNGGAIDWQRDGQSADRPPLPERDQLYCYWLSMETLLDADRQDETLVAELRRALSGGYDLEALRHKEPFALKARPGRTEARELRQQLKALHDVEYQYQTLRRQESEIPALERRIETARAAEEQAGKLKAALELAATAGERKQIEAGLGEFPEHMARLQGRELQSLQKLEDKRDSLQKELEAQKRALEDAGQRLQGTGFTKARPNLQELETRRKNLEQARRTAGRHEQEQQRLDKATAQAQQALADLHGNGDHPRLDPESIHEAETLARELQTLEQQHRELQERLQDAREATDHGEISRHAEAITALRAWLAAEQSMPVQVRIASGIAAAGGLLAAAAAFLSAEWPVAGGGAVAMIAALWALIAAGRAGSGPARRMFEATGLAPPGEWSPDQVTARLRAIEERHAELWQQFERGRQTKEWQEQLKRTDDKLADLRRRKNALAEKLGFDPALTATALDRFVRLVQAYEQAHGECEAARKTIARYDDEIDRIASDITAFLEQWQAAPAGDAANLDALEVALAALSKRLAQAEDADRNMQTARRERDRLERELQETGKEEATLYRDAGLEPGQRRQLEEALERLEDWRSRQQQLNNARIREAEHRKTLDGEERLLRLAGEGKQSELQAALEQAEQQASRLDELKAELTSIRTRLQDAGRDHQLETALAAVDNARAALANRHRETMLAESAHFLLDSVEQEYQSQHEPAVLGDARERFRRFTHHAFELELDETRGFQARDLKQQQVRSLAELSSATRMQLLLAMRLAWTRRLEQKCEPLPLFLDEALTTSDEQRFRQVADSLEQLARDEDRQIFYLSARRHELNLWERATGQRPHHIDLAQVRFGQTEVTPQDFMLPETEALPAPNAQSPEEYAARLGIAPLDPRQPAGSLHLFHLLRDDLGLLYELLEHWRVSSLGQLESLLASSAADAVITDPGRFRNLQGRCKAARIWVDAWRQGRGKPVDRIVLEQSGAVSDRFLDRVSELAAAVNHDGEALIEALREGQVTRFRTSSIDELEQWLQAEGYIDPKQPLSPDDRERQTLQSTAGSLEPAEVRSIVRWLEAALPADQQAAQDPVTG